MAFETCPKTSQNQGRVHPAPYRVQDLVHSLSLGPVPGLSLTLANGGIVHDHAQGPTHLGITEIGTIHEFTKIVTFVVTIEDIEDHTISGGVVEVSIHVVSIIVAGI